MLSAPIMYGVEHSKSSVPASAVGISPAGRNGMNTPRYSSGVMSARNAYAAVGGGGVVGGGVVLGWGGGRGGLGGGGGSATQC